MSLTKLSVFQTPSPILTWLVVFLLLGIFFWHQRKCWQLVWALNGWRGVVLQPLYLLIVAFCFNTKNVIENFRLTGVHFRTPNAVIFFFWVFIYVDDPITVESIFNSPECLNKSLQQEGFFARKGLLHLRGRKWKIRRKQLNPTFNHNILLSFFDTFNAVGNRLQQKFAQELQCDKVSYNDVEDLLSEAVLEASCCTILGATKAEDYRTVAKAYKVLLEISGWKNAQPWLQSDAVFRILDRKSFKNNERCNKLVHQFLSDIMKYKRAEWNERMRSQAANSSQNGRSQKCKMFEKYKEKTNNSAVDSDNVGGNDGTDNGEESSTEKRIFIEQLFHLAAKGELTEQEVMDEVQSMTLVSFETVSDSLTVALLCLAINVDCQDKLRDEIRNILSKHDSGEVISEEGGIDVSKISAAQVQQMKYLDMVISETLRYFNTVVFNMREAENDFVMHMPSDQNSTGTGRSALVHKGTIMLLDIFNMQHNKKYWGPLANQFRPENFTEEEIAKRHPYAFTPFSKGLRNCIGSKYSRFLMKIILVKLIWAFEFRSDVKLEELKPMFGISVKFQNSDKILLNIREINNKPPHRSSA